MFNLNSLERPEFPLQFIQGFDFSFPLDKFHVINFTIQGASVGQFSVFILKLKYFFCVFARDLFKSRISALMALLILPIVQLSSVSMMTRVIVYSSFLYAS